MKKYLFIFLLFMAFGPALRASHVAGGNITYVNIGPNQYRVTLTLYRDCNSVMQGPFGPNLTSQTVFYRNNCGGAPIQLTVQPLPGTGFEVPTPCVDDPSSCNGGTRYGIQRYDWEGVVTLPTSTNTACNEWFFTWGQSATAGFCCRNTNNSLGAPGGNGQVNFFIDSYVNNNVTPGNTSARFNSFQVPAYCVNEPVTVVFDVSEPQGDSIVYSLVPASTGYNVPSAYQTPRTGAVPANVVGNVINIDPATGNLTFTPAAQQTSVFVLKVDEYRAGVLVGYVKIDVQVIMGIGRYCDNVQPTYRLDTLNLNCGTWNDTTLRVELRSRVQCNTIATDASEFRLYDPFGQLVQLRSATPVNCDVQGRTTIIDLLLARPLYSNGSYYLVSRNGTDGNTFGNQCERYMLPFDTLNINVTGCPAYRQPLTITNVSVDTTNPNALVMEWKEPDTLNTSWFLAYNLFRATPAENIYALDKRIYQEMDVNARSHRDVYSPVFPKDSPIRFAMNLVLINGEENPYSNVVQSIRLKNDPPSVIDDETVTINWTKYNGWTSPEYVVQVRDVTRSPDTWVSVTTPSADTLFTYEKPKPQGNYQMRVFSREPVSGLTSYSNPIDFQVPAREVEVPNVITPNGDGKNDRFIVRNLEYYPLAKLYIFNRWGQEVFTSNDYRNDWSGDNLEAGNYFYHLFVNDQGIELQYKGTVKIIR